MSTNDETLANGQVEPALSKYYRVATNVAIISRCVHSKRPFFASRSDPESGDLMSRNTEGVMPGKDFISVHQVHFDRAVMGTVQMRFGCNPVQECMGQHCARTRSRMAAEKSATVSV